jgi:hypothetical protein
MDTRRIWRFMASATERNAVDMPVGAAAVKIW